MLYAVLSSLTTAATTVTITATTKCLQQAMDALSPAVSAAALAPYHVFSAPQALTDLSIGQLDALGKDPLTNCNYLRFVSNWFYVCAILAVSIYNERAMLHFKYVSLLR